MAPTILPVGAITSLLGGPMFIFILVKRIVRMIEVKDFSYAYRNDEPYILHNVNLKIAW